MKNKLLLFTVVTLYFSSCKKPPFVDYFYTINIINQSSKPINVFLADEFKTNQYPDTTLPVKKPSLQKIEVNKTGYFDSRTTWEENLKKLPADTLSIFFIDNEVYETESWDSIRIHYKILKRIDLSIQDLKNSKYLITYP